MSAASPVLPESIQAPDNDVARRFEGSPFYVGLAERVRRAFDVELQAPLASIALATSVLEPQVKIAHARRVLAIAQAAAQMDLMLRDVRDFALCLASGGLRVARRRVDMRVVCERVLEELKRAYPYQPIEFACASGAGGEWDPERIAGLVTKLVLNAIEHARPVRYAIKVTIRAISDRVILEVWNAGTVPGHEAPERLFEPFVRGPSQRGEEPQGLGLGLYLAREIARAHGGTLDVRSTPIDGTTFRATLPWS
jgi:signal transduction histidine kinase